MQLIIPSAKAYLPQTSLEMYFSILSLLHKLISEQQAG